MPKLERRKVEGFLTCRNLLKDELFRKQNGCVGT
jgi:hypothetical protein